MKINYVLLPVFMLLGFNVIAQTCFHKDLSKKYNFETIVHKKTNKSDTIEVFVNVFRKSDGKRTSRVYFEINSEFLFDSEFKSCSDAKSFITGKNKNIDAIDNDFGDLIICDFNFDGKEDIAIKSESGGNGGPSYKYYIQNSKEDFVIDHFLSDTMGYFPVCIDKINKTLTTLVHANAYQNYERTYSISSLGEWKQIEAKLIP